MSSAKFRPFGSGLNVLTQPVFAHNIRARYANVMLANAFPGHKRHDVDLTA